MCPEGQVELSSIVAWAGTVEHAHGQVLLDRLHSVPGASEGRIFSRVGEIVPSANHREKQMLRILIVWLLAPALLLMAGCSDSYPSPAPEPETKVSKTGFTVSVGGITATGTAGVAPVGTEVTLREVPTPPEFAELKLRGSPVVDISLAGGAQPSGPGHVVVDNSS